MQCIRAGNTALHINPILSSIERGNRTRDSEIRNHPNRRSNSKWLTKGMLHAPCYYLNVILQLKLWERKNFLPGIIVHTLGLKFLPTKLYFYPMVDFSAIGKEILPWNTPYLLVCSIHKHFHHLHESANSGWFGNRRTHDDNVDFISSAIDYGRETMPGIIDMDLMFPRCL